MRETLYFDQSHRPAELHFTYLDSRRASLWATVTDGELQHEIGNSPDPQQFVHR